MKLIKLIFLADRLHLARYGRPIVGGRYCAMEHGPVASEFYNDIKECRLDGTFPVESSPKIQATLKADEDFLSESDLEVLHEINDKFGSWDGWRLRNLTHEFQAWKSNYVEGSNSSFAMSYEDFFKDLGGDDQEMLGLIEEAQEAERTLG